MEVFQPGAVVLQCGERGPALQSGLRFDLPPSTLAAAAAVCPAIGQRQCLSHPSLHCNFSRLPAATLTMPFHRPQAPTRWWATGWACST